MIVPLSKDKKMKRTVKISVEKKVSIIGSFNSLLIMYLSKRLPIVRSATEVNVNSIQSMSLVIFNSLIKISFFKSPRMPVFCYVSSASNISPSTTFKYILPMKNIMPIRLSEEEDYAQLASLYKDFFETHDKFQRDQGIVVQYLRKESLEHEFYVYEKDDLIKGGFVLVNTGTNKDGSHKRWKFRHFAFESEPIAEELLGFAEERIKEQSATAKVELSIAESEQAIDFYKKWAYKQEGALSNHYRQGETCFILGKSFG